jgi:mitochondrial pyruvate carrier 1
MTNATAQSIQGTRFLNYWYYGGREQKLAVAASAAETAPGQVTKAIEDAKKVA